MKVQKLHLSLLGTFHLTTNNNVTIKLATDKTRGLLAYLAVEADRPHRREALAGLLWPDMPDAKAKYNLRRTLHRLREALDEAVPGTSDLLLTVDRYVMQLHGGEIWLDQAVFHQAYATYEKHDHRETAVCLECLENLEAAADLYQGEFLAGFFVDGAAAFDEWLLVQREYFHQKALQLLHVLTTMKEQQGEIGAALQYVQQQIALDPYYEPAYRQGMQIQALQGLRSQALALYNQCEQILEEGLGVEPDPQTIELLEQIKENRLTATPARPSQTEIHHFPTVQTPFIGRQRELDEIVTKLTDPACRVLSLLGPGGMGKTRLSVEAGPLLVGTTDGKIPLYGDGIYFISLVNVTDQDLLATTMAQRLGLQLEERTTPRSQLLSYLRDKNLLLVLDNFEQIQNGSALVSDILLRAAGVKFLVTSREPLGVKGEVRQMVRGLDVTGDSSEALELFQRSARRMVPRFTLEAENETAVIELSRLVDGMPLALEIAAAWVRVMNPVDILAETKRNLDFLASPLQDIPERHQSVRVVLAQTWQLLSVRVQGVLNQMALFPVDFSLKAAQHILPELRMLDVATLLDRSLLRGLPQERYEMHALLRQFALGQERPKEQDFKERYSNYYLNLVGAEAEALHGRNPQAAIPVIQGELEHIRQAWDWALRMPQMELKRVDMLRTAVSGLNRFYHLAGLFQEAKQRLVAAVEVVRWWPETAALRQTSARGAQGTAVLLCELCAGASHFLGQTGQYEEAIKQAQLLRKTAAKLAAEGSENWVALSYRLEGEWYRHQGRFAEAEDQLSQALTLFTWPLPNAETAYAYNELGFTRMQQSRYPEALEAFSKAREMYEALGDQTETSTTLGNIGYLYQLQADFPQALAHLTQALEIAERLGYEQGIVKHTLGLGSVYLDQTNIEAARTADEKALRIAEELGYVRGIINSYIQIGGTHFSEGKFQEAGHWFLKARTQAEAAHLRDLTALAIGQQAMVMGVLGDNQAAIGHYEAAIEQWRELNNQTELGRNLSHLANIYFRLGDPEKAIEYFEAGLAVAVATGARQIIPKTTLGLGNAYKRLGQFDKALSYYQQSHSLSEKLGLQAGVSNAIGSIGLVQYELGNYEAAREAYKESLGLSEALGKVLSVGLWWLNIGQVELAMGLYESALDNTQMAIDRFQSLDHQRMRAMGLVQQGQILLEQGKGTLASLSLAKALKIIEPIQEEELLFEGHLLQARLWAALGEREKAVAKFEEMLGQHEAPVDQARVYFRLWEVTGDEEVRRTAVSLYEELLSRAPNHRYQGYLTKLLAG